MFQKLHKIDICFGYVDYNRNNNQDNSQNE
jgi:hypothetical protein